MEASDPTRIQLLATRLRAWLSGTQRIPGYLDFVRWASIASSLGLGWWWFLRRDPLWIQLLAVPWLGATVLPQFGLWLLSSTLRDLLALPDRLLAIKEGLVAQGKDLLPATRRLDAATASERGLLGRLREAYALHGELSQLVATRAILHRFTGPFMVLAGPVSLALNLSIILIALVQLLFILA